MDTAPYNLDFQSVCMLMKQAERLVERLGQLKTAFANEGHGTSDASTNGRPQIDITLRELVVVAKETLELSTNRVISATPVLSRQPQAASGELMYDRNTPPSGATHSAEIITDAPTSNSVGRVESTILSKNAQVSASSSSDQSVILPSLEDNNLLSSCESIRIAGSEQAGTDIMEEPEKRKQLPTSRRLESNECEQLSTGDKRSADDIPLDHLAKRPKVQPRPGAAPSSSDAREVERLVRKLRYSDKLCRASALGAIGNRCSAGMVRRAAAVQGGPAVRQFCSLIYERRSREYEASLLHMKSQGLERALKLSSSLGALTRKTLYGAFLIRLIQYHMAEAVDETKDGRLRTDPAQIRDAMEKFGWNPAERNKFFQYLRQGRQWRFICGQMRGLLCLIPLRSEKPYSVSPTDFLAMKGDEVDQFTSLVSNSGFLQHLNVACEVFQAIVTGTADDRTFRWEREHPQLRSWDDSMDESILATLLQPEPTSHENFILPEDMTTWPKPPAWREEWPWPVNPLAVASSERQCDFCEESKCSCTSERFQPNWLPRIKWYGKSGVGLQAVASHEGDLAYMKGDVIGKLCGRLLPAGTYASNSLWVVDMHRPDIAGDVTICQIYVGGAASVFRNLNHSCRASVRMRPARASSQWVMAIEALRDIRHGEQLTVNFGKKFLRDQGLRCECEVCSGSTSRDGSGRSSALSSTQQ